jgi:Domain of unknown function DUF11
VRLQQKDAWNMRINKLQSLKKILRKISVFTLVVGLLVNTYGVYLQASPVSANDAYKDADCAPPNGTGTHLDKVVFAGSGKVGNIGSQLWVKNCSLNNSHTVSATTYKMICSDQNGKSCDKVVETKNSGTITLKPGGTYNFVVADFSISCGSAQTDIRVSGMSESAGTYYQSTKGSCTTSPQPTTSPAKTMIVGRVVEGSATYWQNTENKCGSIYPASANLSVGGYPVNSCNPHPFYQSGDINPGTKTMTLSGLPSGYSCTWNHEIVNKVLNKAEKVGSGTGCSMTANFQVLDANHENTHFLTYYITRIATPVPTVAPTSKPTPTVAPTQTPAPTVVPTVIATKTPAPTPVKTNPPIGGPTTVPTSSPTPVATTTISPTATPTVAPTQTPAPTASPTVQPSPTPSSTQLKICKYEDDNADGAHNNGENVLSWTFNYAVNGQINSVSSNWWNLLTQGCAIVDIPSNSSIVVSEVMKPGWRPTAVYADGARVDDGTVRDNFTYNFTSTVDDVKVLWFLNTFTPPVGGPQPTNTATPTASPIQSSSPSPIVTPTPAATATIAPTSSPSPTQTVTSNNSNWNISIEKRVDGTRVDGDKVGIQYRVKIKNNDDEDLNNFQVRDTLPPDFTYDQNTTEGDINTNPTIEDVTGDDNRRLVWNVSKLEKGKEINFGYRVTGKREDKNYCNDALVRKDDKTISTSQACVRITKANDTQVLGTTTVKTLPATGSLPAFTVGMVMLLIGAAGWKLSRHAE